MQLSGTTVVNRCEKWNTVEVKEVKIKFHHCLIVVLDIHTTDSTTNRLQWRITTVAGALQVDCVSLKMQKAILNVHRLTLNTANRAESLAAY